MSCVANSFALLLILSTSNILGPEIAQGGSSSEEGTQRYPTNWVKKIIMIQKNIWSRIILSVKKMLCQKNYVIIFEVVF